MHTRSRTGVWVPTPRADGGPSLRDHLDLTGDLQVTLVDGLLWAALAAGAGLLVLLVGFGAAAGLNWLVSRAVWSAVWLAEEAVARTAGVVAGAVVDRRLAVPRHR